ncbi:hypothetical protein [Alcaligenes sp. SDU_A2]|uniref:hypothetical protein n=1 Tax=Alcaligenes sp. SDU_A2 TaxID=3136634 RepID=UPI002C8FBE4D|nr:hypothetical protein [Alcaligenes sp.]
MLTVLRRLCMPANIVNDDKVPPHKVVCSSLGRWCAQRLRKRLLCRVARIECILCQSRKGGLHAEFFKEKPCLSI